MGRPNSNKDRTNDGGRGAKRDKPMSREVMISKKISYVLRHGAAKEGINMDEGGWVNCADLLQWPKIRSLNLTFPELQKIVSSNDKQRFQLAPLPTAPITSGSPADHAIRAAQGHSLPLASDKLLTPILADDDKFPEEVVHGTSRAAWGRILKSGRGLSIMGRTHVHFAIGVPELTAGLKAVQEAGTTKPVAPEAGSGSESDSSDEESDEAEKKPAPPAAAAAAPGEKPKIISGMRAGADVLVWVGVKESMEKGGLEWWRSSNGVVLTEGDEEGLVSFEWIKRVEGRDGSVIWTHEMAKGGDEIGRAD